jgi:hypothetical protein
VARHNATAADNQRLQAAGRGSCSEGMADPLLHYVLDAKPLNTSLRQALMQLSGFLLMRLTRRHNAITDFGPVEAAREVLRGCADGIADLRVPSAAAHHHHHLDGASAALHSALAAALSMTDQDGDKLFHALKAAERHLRATSRLLPGFEAVDFTQACCAAHSMRAAPEAQHFG